MKSKAIFFMDCDYAYTCAKREGQIPNYKRVFDFVRGNYSVVKTIAYHVGAQKEKQGVCEFLHKLGVDYNVMLQYPEAAKVQITGAAMGMDAQKIACSMNSDEINDFIFFTGDDYLVPIVDELSKDGFICTVLFYPAILSFELALLVKNRRIKYYKLGRSFYTHPKVPDEQQRIYRNVQDCAEV